MRRPKASYSTALTWAIWKWPKPSISATWAFLFTASPSAATFDSAVVKADLEFKAPARVDDLLELHTRVSRIGHTSLTLAVEIYPEKSERLLTRLTAVYVGFSPATETTRPVPAAIRALIHHFEATGEVLPLANFPELLLAAADAGRD